MNTAKPTNQLPQSIESEKMVLGCMLTRPDALNRCCAFLQSSDFTTHITKQFSKRYMGFTAKTS